MPFLAPSGKMEAVCLVHDQTESIWRRRPLMTRGILAEGHRETIKSGLRLHPTIASRSKAGLHWRERSHLAVPATDLHINTNPLNSISITCSTQARPPKCTLIIPSSHLLQLIDETRLHHAPLQELARVRAVESLARESKHQDPAEARPQPDSMLRLVSVCHIAR